MKRITFGLMGFALAMMLVALPAVSQQPGGKGKDGQDGKDAKGKDGQDGKGKMSMGKGGFKIGMVLPPQLVSEMNLTEEQMTKLQALEKEVKEKLDKMLTAEQKQMVENFQPKGMGKGGDQKGGKGGKGGDNQKGDAPPKGKDNVQNNSERAERPVIEQGPPPRSN